MCTVVERFMEEGRKEGRKEGREDTAPFIYFIEKDDNNPQYYE